VHPSSRMAKTPLHLRIQGAAGRALLGLPRPTLVALSGGARVERDGCILDEQVQCMLALAARLGRGEVRLDDVAAARKDMDIDAPVFGHPMVEMAKVTDEPVSAGVTARIYRPFGVGSPAPVVVFLHGGGFVIGSLASHDLVCRALARDVGCVVIAIDYRLAPEHPFPAAADDATEAFRWVIREHARLGIDPTRVAVGGDSAGGNLSAVVALDTRDDTHRPVLQCLVYPIVDNTRSFPSAKIMAEGFLLTEHSIAGYRARYLPSTSLWEHPRASPWFARDVSNLPPALVQTAGFDPLRDEGEAYAKKLRDAGVRADVRRYPSLIHGYLNMVGSIVAAREPWNDLVAALRSALAV
jgi:acetyl esterase